MLYKKDSPVLSYSLIVKFTTSEHIVHSVLGKKKDEHIS